MSSTSIPDNPLDRIALCCSGGGYRAASFHLGGLSYLHRLQYRGKPLLNAVKAMSTVSGGTILGVVYALHQQKGRSFEDFYTFFIKQLRSVDLVRLALEKLNQEALWINSYKKRNLINAFAEIYDEHFTQGETFDAFNNMVNGHLKEVMFNATEFSKGLIFRFQSDGRFGNYYFPVKKDISAEIKLADIIAASSCFTGGFEPIMWPEDFRHEESIELNEETPLLNSVGLMDGGIYDNQGIDSILLAETRVGSIPFDLILVSDVTSPYLHPFKSSPTNKKLGWRDWTLAKILATAKQRFNLLKWSAWAILFGSGVYLSVMPWIGSVVSGLVIGVFIFTLMLLATLLWGRSKILSYVESVKEYVQAALADELPLDALSSLSISKILFRDLEPLIIDRIKSLGTLVSAVFLKTVRRLVYGRLYDSEKHQYRRAGNLIRQLTRDDFEIKRRRAQKEANYFQNLSSCPAELMGNYDQVVGPELEKVVETAASFGTTLWFTEADKVNEMLDALLISGQASMCFTIMTYLIELCGTPNNGFAALPAEKKLEIEKLWQQCLEDWKRFKAQPDFLLS
jgi:predicted acylesterase/phospholipase RssA